ncbi:hypothetical protein QTP70_003737, partial [Hemibagrus guttatus]
MPPHYRKIWTIFTELRPVIMFTVIFMYLCLSLGDSMADSIEPLFTHKVVDEGDDVTLSCKYESAATNNYVHWYRQYPKSNPEFLLYIYQSGEPKSEPHPRMSANVKDKQVDLIISSAAVSDSALYYCALAPTVTGNPAALYKNLDTVLLYSRQVVHVKVKSTRMAGPKVSQQNIAQSMTLPLPACLLPTVHPGAMFSPGDSMADSVEPLFTHKAVDEGSFADKIGPKDEDANIVKKERETVTLKCSYETSSERIYLYWYKQYPNSAPQFLLYEGARSYAGDSMADPIEPLLTHKVVEEGESTQDSITPTSSAVYGVAEKYVRVVQDMYERSRTVVRCAVGQTEEFKVEVGLHQGSALSPFLFAIVMDQLSEEVRQESPWTMMFADDIVICSESREQVEENLERWRFALERRGMKVSRSKTEYMCVNEREGSGTVRLQGEEVKKVQEFKYLGSTVQSNGECGKEVKKRVQAGWNGWRKVSGVLCDQKISARIKGKVYRTVVRPAMLYGLETVSLRKRQESELEVAELKMLRFSLGVTRLDRIRNEYIRGTAHVGRLGDKVREARLRWFGHVQRRE